MFADESDKNSLVRCDNTYQVVPYVRYPLVTAELGGFLKSIKKAVKKVSKTVSKTVKKVGKTIKKASKSVGKVLKKVGKEGERAWKKTKPFMPMIFDPTGMFKSVYAAPSYKGYDYSVPEVYIDPVYSEDIYELPVDTGAMTLYDMPLDVGYNDPLYDEYGMPLYDDQYIPLYDEYGMEIYDEYGSGPNYEMPIYDSYTGQPLNVAEYPMTDVDLYGPDFAAGYPIMTGQPISQNMIDSAYGDTRGYSNLQPVEQFLYEDYGAPVIDYNTITPDYYGYGSELGSLRSNYTKRIYRTNNNIKRVPKRIIIKKGTKPFWLHSVQKSSNAIAKPISVDGLDGVFNYSNFKIVLRVAAILSSFIGLSGLIKNKKS